MDDRATHALRLCELLSGRRPLTRMRQLQRLQWLSAEELHDLALRRLRTLLAHAASQVPYYRDLFASAGLDANTMREVADLTRLPTSNKADLRAVFPSRVVASGLERRRRTGRTSGSTGQPFEFYVDRANDDRVLGSYLFCRAWAGAPLGLAVVYIGGPTFGVRTIARSSASMQMARRLLFGERLVQFLGTADVDPRDVVRALDDLGRGSGYFVIGAPSYIGRLAARLSAAGLEPTIAPRAVISQAESLTPGDLALIGRVFRAPVINHYSCHELLHLAQTCPDNPELLHVNGARAIVRVIRDDGSPAAIGEVGRLVLTDLWNEVMPFINYDIGDRAAFGGPCPCGRGFPTLASIEGRASELIRTPSGATISAVALGRLLLFGCGGLPHIWEYQAEQTAADAVVLRIVPTPSFTPAFGRRVQAEFEAFLGPGVRVRLDLVERIPTEPSGKRLIIRSRLAGAPAYGRGSAGSSDQT